MTPLDWLRAKARARNLMAAYTVAQPPATGGIITADQAPILHESGCDYIVPRTSLGADGKFLPVTSIELELTLDFREPTPADAERMAQLLGLRVGGNPVPRPEQPARVEPNNERTAMLTTRAKAAAHEETAAANCPCAIIYSRCYYPVTHAAARPRTTPI